MSMLPPSSTTATNTSMGTGSRHSTPGRRVSLGLGTSRRSLGTVSMTASPLATPTRPSRRDSMDSSTSGTTPSQLLLLQTPGSLASASSLSSSNATARRRSLHRRTPKANEPLARIASAASTVVVPLARTPEEISASYEQWMKLAADNKINAANSWHLGLIDYFADMRILKEGDGGINFQKASCTLDGCVKIYSTRVDAVASETEVLVSGLNDAKQAAAHAAAAAAAAAASADNDDPDHLDEDDDGTVAAAKAAADRRAKRAARKANLKTLEKDFTPITTPAIDVEFMIDPLFRKTCAEFDEGGADSLLLSKLTVGPHGQIIFDSSGVVENTGRDAAAAPSTQQDARGGVDLTHFSSLATIMATDLGTKSMCPTLASFVLSDELRGVESLTQVLELDLLDDLAAHMPAPSSSSSSSSSAVFAPLTQQPDPMSTDDAAPMEMDDNAYVPLTLPPSLPTASDDFYSEANLFDDDDDDNDFDHVAPAEAAADGYQDTTAPPAAAPMADIPDDQFLLLPLPRARGVLAAAATSQRTHRLAQLRPRTAPSARKPPATLDFLTLTAPRYEDVFAKGGSGINLPRATLATAPGADGMAAMADTTSLELHVATDPFDPRALVRSALKPRGVYPRAIARDVAACGAVARMVELLGGVQDEDDKDQAGAAKVDDDAADVGGAAAADWDVEAPVLDDGELVPEPTPAVGFVEEDMAMDADAGPGFTDGRVLDPIVAEDLEMRAMDQVNDDLAPPVFDLTIDATALGGGFLGTSAPSHAGATRTGPPLISAFTQHMAGGGTAPASSQFRRNRMALNFAKRSKRVDVKKLKENIWRTIRRGAVLDAVADPDARASSDENKEGSGDKAAGKVTDVVPHGQSTELAFQDVVKQVGQAYSTDQFKDISVPFCFICVLHLANEKNLQLEAKGMADLVVKPAQA